MTAVARMDARTFSNLNVDGPSSPPPHNYQQQLHHHHHYHDPPLGDLLSAICIAGERIIVRFVEDVSSSAFTIVAATAYEMTTTKTMTAKYATFSYQMPTVVNTVVMSN